MRILGMALLLYHKSKTSKNHTSLEGETQGLKLLRTLSPQSLLKESLSPNGERRVNYVKIVFRYSFQGLTKASVSPGKLLRFTFWKGRARLGKEKVFCKIVHPQRYRLFHKD